MPCASPYKRCTTTGQRPVAAGIRPSPAADERPIPRCVRTAAGWVLYDDSGRFLGIVTTPPDGGPAFGPAAGTVYLRRDL